MRRDQEPIRGVSRAVLSFLSSLLIILTVPSVFVIPAEAILFRPYSYERALANQNFAARFPDLLAEALIGGDISTTQGGQELQIAYFDRAQLAALLAGIFPQDWIEEQTSGILRGVGDYVNFQRSDLIMQVDLRAVKERISGPQGAEIARSTVASWPECSQEDVGKIMGLAASGGLQGIPICRPPDALRPVFEQVVHATMRVTAAALPDVLDLGSPLTNETVLPGVSGPLVPNWYGIFRAYAILRWLFRLLPVLALAALLWIVLLTIRSLPDLLRSAGTPMITAGLVSLGIALVLALLLNPLAARLLSNAFPLLPDAFRGLLAGVFQEVTNRAAMWSAFLALAVSGLGFALVIGGRALEPEELADV